MTVPVHTTVQVEQRVLTPFMSELRKADLVEFIAAMHRADMGDQDTRIALDVKYQGPEDGKVLYFRLVATRTVEAHGKAL